MTHSIAKTLILVAVLAAALAFAATIGADRSVQTTTAPSFSESHGNAHVDNLPIQDVDDRSVVYPRAAQRQ